MTASAAAAALVPGAVIVAMAAAISEREERSSNAGFLQPCVSRCRCMCAPIICIELLRARIFCIICDGH
jgi:hypothetical protein